MLIDCTDLSTWPRDLDRRVTKPTRQVLPCHLQDCKDVATFCRVCDLLLDLSTGTGQNDPELEEPDILLPFLDVAQTLLSVRPPLTPAVVPL